MSKYDKAGIVQIPSGYKAGTLYSVVPTNSNGDFDVTRASTATRVNKDGLIETVAANVPRLDYPLVNGVVQDCAALLLEPSRTNIALYSEDFTNSAWIKTRSTITGNQAVSPDGSVTADKITGTGTGTSYFYDGFSVTSGTVYTISIFAKKINVNNFYINNFTQSGSITFDLSDGTIDTSASGTFSGGKIENYGNDWYRLSVQYTASATASVNIGFYGQDSALDGAYVWGAQLEQGSYPTSYIPTSDLSVTRSADVCGDSGTSAEINSEEGVLYIETSALANDLSERRFGISDGGSGNVVRVGYTGVSNRIIAVVYNGGNQAIMTYTSPDITTNSKIAVKYKANDFALWVDGGKRSTDTIGVTFAAGTLNSLDFNVNGGSHFYSKTKQVTVFTEALSDSELQQLTS